MESQWTWQGLSSERLGAKHEAHLNQLNYLQTSINSIPYDMIHVSIAAFAEHRSENKTISPIMPYHSDCQRSLIAIVDHPINHSPIIRWSWTSRLVPFWTFLCQYWACNGGWICKVVEWSRSQHVQENLIAVCFKMSGRHKPSPQALCTPASNQISAQKLEGQDSPEHRATRKKEQEREHQKNMTKRVKHPVAAGAELDG